MADKLALLKFFGSDAAVPILLKDIHGDGTQYAVGMDAGCAWTSIYGVSGAGVTSANASSTPLVVTDSPGASNKIVLDDLLISTDTVMLVTIRTTTGAIVLARLYLAAYSPVQVTFRGKVKTPTVNQTIEILTSTAGNIAATAIYHVEP
jgi:hypothetical protein